MKLGIFLLVFGTALCFTGVGIIAGVILIALGALRLGLQRAKN